MLLAFGIRRPLQRELRRAQLTHMSTRQSRHQHAWGPSHSTPPEPAKHHDVARQGTFRSQLHDMDHTSGPLVGQANRAGAQGPISATVGAMSCASEGSLNADRAGDSPGLDGSIHDHETIWMVTETFLEVRKLLEELDVADDITCPKVCHTHAKFRQCFGLEPCPGQLQVKGPLRVPQE